MKLNLSCCHSIGLRLKKLSIAACSSAMWFLLLAGDLGLAQNSTKTVEKANLNMVRVMITVNGLELSPSRVQPGVAQLWIENKTAIPKPQLLISTIQTVGQREETKAKTKVQALSKGQRAWNEVTLSAGTYLVSLEGAPEVQTRLVVAPKN